MTLPSLGRYRILIDIHRHCRGVRTGLPRELNERKSSSFISKLFPRVPLKSIPVNLEACLTDRDEQSKADRKRDFILAKGRSFVDVRHTLVRGGKGGAGCVSWFHEPFVRYPQVFFLAHHR